MGFKLFPLVKCLAILYAQITSENIYICSPLHHKIIFNNQKAFLDRDTSLRGAKEKLDHAQISGPKIILLNMPAMDSFAWSPISKKPRDFFTFQRRRGGLLFRLGNVLHDVCLPRKLIWIL